MELTQLSIYEALGLPDIKALQEEVDHIAGYSRPSLQEEAAPSDTTEESQVVTLLAEILQEVRGLAKALAERTSHDIHPGTTEGGATG